MGNEAKDLFKSRFAGPFKAINYGIGGDSTHQILWRLKHGAVDGIAPKVVVLLIGTNNLYDDANGGNDEEMAKGIGTVVQKDQLHLVRMGYEAMADVIEPVMKEMCR